MSNKEQQAVSTDIIEGAMTYKAYQKLIKAQLEKGKTTGTKQSEELTKYTRLNLQRMNRIDQRITLDETVIQKLQQVQGPWIWLVLTEGWCGDAAQNIPVIHKMAEQTSHIDLKLILRTENPDIMDQYLTNGGRSIPKLVCLHAETLAELGTWGPRPADFQQEAMQWKEDASVSHEEWAQKLHKWYAKDEGSTIQHDFVELIDKWNAKS